jgi:alpha-N-arabinofuranosidase
MVSLFPQKTWKNRPGGLRADMVQLLADLKPGFLRFPGGCIVEGRTLDQRYQWKTTLGDLDERQLIINRWNTEFNWRPTPDYYQSFGLGYYEYFLLSEDIGAEPLPIMNCGMACQFNSSELAPMEDLDHFIQDAIDLIEFANAPANTKWGRKRAEMGHPKPFNLKMIGVGNEQWGPQYVERYEVFARTLKQKYPNIELVSSAGPSPDGERFDFLWKKMRELNADLIDEHYYMAPKWFRDNAERYDNYPRQGPKVFAGEYAAQSVGVASPDNRNTWECAMSEAAFITGLERNSDVVKMSSYAPLFGHVDAWQWTPNMIWFDNLHSYGTPNYYVQKLFSVNRGTRQLPLLFDGSPKNGQHELYSSASLDENTGEVILKVVNTGSAAKDVRVGLAGTKTSGKTGTAFVLQSEDLKAENSLDHPTKVAPVERQLSVLGGEFSYTFLPHSFTVLRIPTK